MRSRLTTVLLVLALAMFATAGTFAASAHISKGKGHHAKKHSKHAKKKHAKKHSKHAKKHQTTTAPDDSRSSAQSQYGTRPGKGCGDRNHVHTGPPGNPSNTSCPPKSQHNTTTTTTTKAKSKKAHAKRKHKKSRKRHRRGH